MVNKYLISLLPLVLLFTNFLLSEAAVKYTSIFFKTKDLDAGKIKLGEVVTKSYYIKNIGSNPLNIESVTSGCGCTVVKFNKTLEPLKSDSITILFDSGSWGKTGEIEKNIVVRSNTKSHFTFLKFHVFVNP